MSAPTDVAAGNPCRLGMLNPTEAWCKKCRRCTPEGFEKFIIGKAGNRKPPADAKPVYAAAKYQYVCNLCNGVIEPGEQYIRRAVSRQSKSGLRVAIPHYTCNKCF